MKNNTNQIMKLNIPIWIKYWLSKHKNASYVLSEILTGTEFFLQDSAPKKFKIFDIIGRTTQESDPTPENPIPIKNTGDNGSVNEKVQNKNFLNVSSAFEVTGYTSIPISLEANENYILSANKINTNGSSNNILVGLNNEDNTIDYMYSFKTNNLTVNFTPQKNVVAILIYSQDNYNHSVGVTSTFYDLMISKEGGEYQPHEEQNISFPLAQGQKLMEGDYLADDGVHHKRGQVVLDGTENWNKGSSSPTGSVPFYIPKPNNISSTATLSDLICSHFISQEVVNGIRLANYLTFYVSSDLGIETTTQWKEWLSQHTVKLQYPLATEGIDPFTSAQQTAWEQIKKARTYKNITHISSEDETPANLKIQYYKEV